MLQNKPADERGNAFIIILVAVVMFVALAFVITRGLQSQTTTALSGREVSLAATEVMDYAQRVERAVNRVRSSGCSENEISFDNPVESGYDYGTPEDKCKIFNPAGGAITWSIPPQNIKSEDIAAKKKGGSTPLQYLISGANRVTGIGAADKNELLLILPSVTLEVCNKINEALGISLATMPPVDGATLDTATKFTGSFSANFEIGATGGGTAGFDGLTSACFKRGLLYSFYHTLIVR